MKTIEFFRVRSTSLVGNVVLAELFGMVPVFLVFSVLFYSEGTLTADWAIYMALLCALGGVIGGILIWFTIIKPLKKGRELEATLARYARDDAERVPEGRRNSSSST